MTIRLAVLVLLLASASPGMAAQPGAEACRWSGIHATVLTPWSCCGHGVDEQALAAQIDFQLGNGVNGLLVLGTIGEGAHATHGEREQVIRVAVERARGCVPVVVGIHTCDPDLALKQMSQARELGAQAVLVKYAGRPSACFAEVYSFYQCLAAANYLPIFYYHYPAQTGLKLTPIEVAQILRLSGMVGIKESTLDLRELEAHRALTCDCDLAFLSGTALNLTQFLDSGGHGAMCPEAVLLPARTAACYAAYRRGCPEEARRIQRELFVVAPVLRGGLATAGSTRAAVMSTQDLHLPLPMRSGHPQARLKFALSLLGIRTSPLVKPELPQLSQLDQQRVLSAMPDIAARQ
jgi:4-hydroxy-tetrahydrodipicolinate synthase